MIARISGGGHIGTTCPRRIRSACGDGVPMRSVHRLPSRLGSCSSTLGRAVALAARRTRRLRFGARTTKLD